MPRTSDGLVPPPAGLRPGDVVVGVNGHPLTNANQFTSVVSSSADRPVDLDVLRDGHEVHLSVVPVVGHDTAQGGEALGRLAAHPRCGSVRARAPRWRS